MICGVPPAPEGRNKAMGMRIPPSCLPMLPRQMSALMRKPLGWICWFQPDRIEEEKADLHGTAVRRSSSVLNHRCGFRPRMSLASPVHNTSGRGGCFDARYNREHAFVRLIHLLCRRVDVSPVTFPTTFRQSRFCYLHQLGCHLSQSAVFFAYLNPFPSPKSSNHIFCVDAQRVWMVTELCGVGGPN